MKIVCIGRNYVEHARELGNERPAEPVIFLKPSTSLHEGDYWPLPRLGSDIHYEAELVLRVARRAKDVDASQARYICDAVTVGIDFTARTLQGQLKARGLPWEKAKAFDGSAVVGAWRPIAPGRAHGFDLTLNGHLVQRGHSREMVFGIDRLLAEASRFFTLEPGDLLFTGTPAGVGPVSVGDELVGTLDGERVLRLRVR